MNWKILQNHFEISDFSCNIKNELVLIQNNKTLIIFYNDTFISAFSPGSEISDVHINENSVIWFNQLLEETKSFVSFKNQSFQKFDFVIKQIIGNNIYCSDNGKGKKIDKEQNLVWTLESRFFKYLISNNIFYYIESKNLLICFDDNFGDEIWKFRLSDHIYNWSALNYKNELINHQAEIKRIVGVYENIIWIVLNSGRLLGLDLADGNIKFDIFEIDNYYGSKALFAHYDPEVVASKDWALYFLQYAQLDEKRGVLFGLRNYYYFEIDLKNPENSFKIYDSSQSFLEFQIEADMANGYEWTWNKDDIFFGHNFTAFNNLGVFNRVSKNVTWATRLEQENGQTRNISKIEYGSGNLYVLDQLKTLHIFKEA